MRIWLIKLGEPLPLDGPSARLMRAGLLAAALVRNGHEVVYWSSTFDHFRKRFRAPASGSHSAAGCEIELLHGCGYRRNVSLARLRDHRQVAREFLRRAPEKPRPDLILSSLPTLDMSAAATRLGREWTVPVVVDVRDLWPDVFLDFAPPGWRWAARAALSPLYRRARQACRDATAITGVTRQYVDWGLGFAGRPAGAFDRDFPLGYSQTPPSEEEREAALAFWRARGLAPGDGRFVACFFGTIGRHFEMECVIRAARLLRESGRDARFVLCGDGPDLEKCRALAGDCPNVLFPGWIDAAQIWTLMRQSTVGLAPYVNSDNFLRNLPNKPIEYLSAGLPILTSLRGVLGELIADEDCGLAYDALDAGGLARRCTELMQSPDRLATMSRRADAVFEQRFVAEAVYADMRDHLLAIANHPTHARAA